MIIHNFENKYQNFHKWHKMYNLTFKNLYTAITMHQVLTSGTSLEHHSNVRVRLNLQQLPGPSGY